MRIRRAVARPRGPLDGHDRTPMPPRRCACAHLNRAGIESHLEALRQDLQMPEAPHSASNASTSATRAGEGTVASCVVFGPEGPIKTEYRRFNIAGIDAGR